MHPLRDLIKDAPLMKKSLSKEKRPSVSWDLNLRFLNQEKLRRVLYSCATTATHWTLVYSELLLELLMLKLVEPWKVLIGFPKCCSCWLPHFNSSFYWGPGLWALTWARARVCSSSSLSWMTATVRIKASTYFLSNFFFCVTPFSFFRCKNSFNKNLVWHSVTNGKTTKSRTPNGQTRKS